MVFACVQKKRNNVTASLTYLGPGDIPSSPLSTLNGSSNRCSTSATLTR